MIDSLTVITGAAGNIGRAVASQVVSRGGSVALFDREGSLFDLEETRDRCESERLGSVASVGSFDVRNAAEVDAAMQRLADDVAVPDCLFNNAGMQGRFVNTLDVGPEEIARTFEVNVFGVFNVLGSFGRLLRSSSRSGTILNVASMAGVSGAANMPAYSASKGAVLALTKSAAKDLAEFGIRVNSISPGFIGPGGMWDSQVRGQAEVASQYFADTDEAVAQQMIGQIPLRRYGSLNEVAKAATFLLSDDSSYLTGTNLEVSGGAA